MSKDVKIRKGVNIKLKGVAERLCADAASTSDVVIKPTDFPGLTPKLSVKVGDKVKAGSPLFFNKENDRVMFTSPISGEVTEINRGEKRRILEVKVKADGANTYETFKQGDPANMAKEEVLATMLKSGVWPFIRQRPFDIVANPMVTPNHIVPEWYLLPFYAILRSVPDKLGGVVVMFAAVFILMFLPWLDTSKVRSAVFRPLYKVFFWILVIDVIVLGYIGANPPEGMYLIIGRIATIYYFVHFFVLHFQNLLKEKKLNLIDQNLELQELLFLVEEGCKVEITLN